MVLLMTNCYLKNYEELIRRQDCEMCFELGGNTITHFLLECVQFVNEREKLLSIIRQNNWNMADREEILLKVFGYELCPNIEHEFGVLKDIALAVYQFHKKRNEILRL